MGVDLLTHLQPFQIAAEMETKVQNLTFDINFMIEMSIVKKL